MIDRVVDRRNIVRGQELSSGTDTLVMKYVQPIFTIYTPDIVQRQIARHANKPAHIPHYFLDLNLAADTFLQIWTKTFHTVLKWYPVQYLRTTSPAHVRCLHIPPVSPYNAHIGRPWKASRCSHCRYVYVTAPPMWIVGHWRA